MLRRAKRNNHSRSSSVSSKKQKREKASQDEPQMFRHVLNFQDAKGDSQVLMDLEEIIKLFTLKRELNSVSPVRGNAACVSCFVL